MTKEENAINELLSSGSQSTAMKRSSHGGVHTKQPETTVETHASEASPSKRHSRTAVNGLTHDSRPATLKSLPVEIIGIIFSFADEFDLARLEATCRPFNAVIATFRLWDKLQHPVIKASPALQLSVKDMIKLFQSKKCCQCEERPGVVVLPFRKRLCGKCVSLLSKCWIDAVNEDHLPVDIAFKLPGMSGTELPSDGTPQYLPFIYLLVSDIEATLAQHAQAVQTNTFDAWFSEFEKRSHTVSRAFRELHCMYHMWQVYVELRDYSFP
ncbi:hypothetical protein SeMB42_g04737 [Synchytrium endobioticum]|uniref:F-box domain-containing protein n=1 Tax=Synchytrium endobioticum TaxID=286115 RepID=A0A507CW75_9FUNG|nr:hypothetical protein SeMB42_g04737 [Synchytrium endobioticum]